MGLLIALVLVCCLALFWQVAADGPLFIRLILWVGLGLFGALATPFGLLGLMRYRAYLLSATAPTLIAAMCALVLLDIPETVGWQLSRAVLEGQSTDCADPGHHTRLGIYTVTAVTRRDGGCLFYTEGAGVNSHGFAYYPNAVPTSPGISFKPVEGAWYRFTRES
ncbi:hypothetical protein [Nocardia australiensis]|uniref:hypothetical protein n=1 Tax=Nocardia australiensis TaxID=2887191 RepID=UPI001D13B97E|nr:hypothetical protein [Nocardia australiensis]